MPRPEVLDRITEAEQEADEIVEAARARPRGTYRGGARRGRRDPPGRSRGSRGSRGGPEDRLESAREEIAAEREQILEEGEQARAELEDRAAGETEAVVEYVTDLFEEAVHAQT